MHNTITIAHGSGGKATERLLDEVIFAELKPVLFAGVGHDGAVLSDLRGPPVVSTDSYVVSPHTFPGGDIGKLAVTGTVNDLLAAGARPRYLSLALILEDGFPLADLRRYLKSIRETARTAGVLILGGDTKVVERGAADGIYINTTGIGSLLCHPIPEPQRITACSDEVAVIVTGTVGDHGVAVSIARHMLPIKSPIRSDCAPLGGLLGDLLADGRILCLRDPTRGGLATALNEIAKKVGVTIELDEQRVPVDSAVRGACQLLGLDPYTLANEGKMLLFVPDSEVASTLRALRAHPLGARAAHIGRVVPQQNRPVLLKTALGVLRPMEMPSGAILPRIC